jgi:hypothetical protein
MVSGEDSKMDYRREGRMMGDIVLPETKGHDEEHREDEDDRNV